jgi:hypothetical protein
MQHRGLARDPGRGSARSAGGGGCGAYLRSIKDKLRHCRAGSTWIALRTTSASVISKTHASSRSGKAKPRFVDRGAQDAAPLLALPEYYEEAKYGYAREYAGGVRRPRARSYDMLLAHSTHARGCVLGVGRCRRLACLHSARRRITEIRDSFASMQGLAHGAAIA